ncbi:selenide, water dikinase SelD [Rossellomorea aquimaris]|nr:selenide, water dikinase SelD [Rossellomorea aquimaris]
MTQVLRQLPPQPYTKELLVGSESSDDGGIFQLTADLAMVQTVDYFTPIVDDPFQFGQIAAANALSDVYAMGGTPKTVLNIVGFPIKKLGGKILAEILSGAQSKVIEAGAVTVGGHSIDDQEPKFGLSVTGIVHPERYWTNNGAQEGDILVLTKPLGVGIMTTGIKRQVVTHDQEMSVIQVMSMLNKKAAEVLQEFSPNAVTDVTGFGLMGHAYEMAKGSNLSLEFSYASIPLLEGTKELADQGIIPGGSKANHKWLQEKVNYDPDLTQEEQWILCDAITSGGLLISLPASQGERYLEELNKHAITASIIGRVKPKQNWSISVKK